MCVLSFFNGPFVFRRHYDITSLTAKGCLFFDARASKKRYLLTPTVKQFFINNKRGEKWWILLRTVLDSIDIVPTDRKRTENVFALSVLFSLQALLLWSQMRLFNCRYASRLALQVFSARYICLAANSLCFRYAQARYDIDPRSRSEHIECVSTYRTRQRISKIRASGSISTRSVLKGTTLSLAPFAHGLALQGTRGSAQIKNKVKKNGMTLRRPIPSYASRPSLLRASNRPKCDRSETARSAQASRQARALPALLRSFARCI